jgi:hypothetical protein
MPQTLTSDKPSLFYCSCTYADAFSIVAMRRRKKRGEEKKKRKKRQAVQLQFFVHPQSQDTTGG